MKHVGETPAGRGPAVIHSLSNAGTLPFSDGVVVLDESDGAVAWNARVTRAAAAGLLVRRGLT